MLNDINFNKIVNFNISDIEKIYKEVLKIYNLIKFDE